MDREGAIQAWGTRGLFAAARAGCLAAVVLAAGAPGARAETFGVKIDQLEADNTQWSCGSPAGPYAPGIGGGTNCSIYGVGPPVGFSTAVPLPDPSVVGVTETTGTITQVRVKTGPIPGGSAQARLAIYRTASTSAQAACCIGKSLSATVTLRANTVNRLVTDFRVSSKRNGQYLSYDTLALQMLDPTTPFPAAISNLNLATPYLSVINVPAIGLGEERFTGNISAPLIPLIEADLTVDPISPAPGPGPGPTPGPIVPSPTPTPAARAKVSRGRAAVQLQCPPGAACAGNLVLSSRAAAAAGRSATRKATIYGVTGYTVAGAKKASVPVKLNSKGRRVLRRSRSATAWLIITPTGGAAKSSRIRLTR